jgi:potassium-dependent mechanosensitive channel
MIQKPFRMSEWFARRVLPVLFVCLGIAVLAAALPDIVQAQTTASSTQADDSTTGPDYGFWQDTAARAEAAIESQRASTPVLEELRAEIVGWRESFLSAQSVNAPRIATLRTQIDALGPVPEGGNESEEIAARRAELTEQLTRLRAPALAAEEAHTRASGIIAEIDRIIRERQTDALLTRGASPLNPALWPRAVQELAAAGQMLSSETSQAWADPAQREATRENLPITLVLTAIGLVLILRGRRWANRLGGRLYDRWSRGKDVWGFLVSLTQVAIPLAGIFVLTEALFATGLVGLKGAEIVDTLPVWGAILLGARWLAGRLFPARMSEPPLAVQPERRAEARYYSTALAFLIVAQDFIGLLSQIAELGDDTLVIISFPVILLTALVLYRLGQFLTGQMAIQYDDDSVTPGYRDRAARLLSKGAMLVAIVAPVAAAIGYTAAASGLIYPFVLTLALLSVVLILQKLVSDTYAFVTHAPDGQTDALIPVLIGFLLTVLALPVLALIWGARIADLTEVWARFREGFSIGGSRISPTDFLAFVLIFTIGYALTRVVQGALRTSVLPKTKIDPGGQNAIVVGLGYVGIFVAALIAITSAGIDLSSIAIVAGALSVGIGFGLQNIVSNFVSGIILLIERPISEGDWIEVGGQQGYVRDISVRSTRIETFDRTDVIVPNADLVSGTVTNFTRGNTVGRVIVKVGVAYGTDTRRVETILREIAEAQPMVLAQPAPGILFQGFGADSLDFEIRAILRDVNWMMSVKSEINHQIAKRFAEEGIEIPFAQRDIWIRNPEALRGADTPAKAPVAATVADSRAGQAAPSNDKITPPSDTIRDVEMDDAGDNSGGEGDR